MRKFVGISSIFSHHGRDREKRCRFKMFISSLSRMSFQDKMTSFNMHAAIFSPTAIAAHSPINSNKPSVTSHYFFLLHFSQNETHLRHLHAHLLRTSLYNNVILTSKLVLMYSHLQSPHPYSLSVFFHMPRRNIYSWNIIIGVFCRSGFLEKSLDLFLHLWRETDDVRPNDFSFPLALRACADSGAVELGIATHGLCVKMGWERSLFVASSLVSMYANFGDVVHARAMFDEIHSRDSVLWTAMLAGYAQLEEPYLCFDLFREMVKQDDIELDGVVMISLLLACGQSSCLRNGKSVHGWCVRNCLGTEVNLGNAIVDFYIKCATMAAAHKMFDHMPVKDIFSWSSLILGYGLNGEANVAIDLFDQMQMMGIRPNSVTFLGILSACAHGGLVELARSYFRMMNDHGVLPEIKHYTAMVDCLAKAGLVEDAERLIAEMPMKPDASVLCALLAGCRLYHKVDVGERAAKKLIQLQPDNDGCFVLLCNIYAAAGKFDEAARIRDLMKEDDIFKVPACSFIEPNFFQLFSHKFK